MRKIILGMAMVAVASSAFAQTIYEQKTYVFTGLPDGSNIIEDADAQKECEQGIKWLANRQFYGINPSYFLKVKVHAVNIIQRNGGWIRNVVRKWERCLYARTGSPTLFQEQIMCQSIMK